MNGIRNASDGSFPCVLPTANTLVSRKRRFKVPGGNIGRLLPHSPAFVGTLGCILSTFFVFSGSSLFYFLFFFSGWIHPHCVVLPCVKLIPPFFFSYLGCFHPTRYMFIGFECFTPVLVFGFEYAHPPCYFVLFLSAPCSNSCFFLYMHSVLTIVFL